MTGFVLQFHIYNACSSSLRFRFSSFSSQRWFCRFSVEPVWRQTLTLTGARIRSPDSSWCVTGARRERACARTARAPARRNARPAERVCSRSSGTTSPTVCGATRAPITSGSFSRVTEPWTRCASVRRGSSGTSTSAGNTASAIRATESKLQVSSLYIPVINTAKPTIIYFLMFFLLAGTGHYSSFI